MGIKRGIIVKWKKWLIERFLPAWCREELLSENRRLREQLQRQEEKISRLNAYIDGIQDALRCRQKIIIQGGGK